MRKGSVSCAKALPRRLSKKASERGVQEGKGMLAGTRKRATGQEYGSSLMTSRVLPSLCSLQRQRVPVLRHGGVHVSEHKSQHVIVAHESLPTLRAILDTPIHKDWLKGTMQEIKRADSERHILEVCQVVSGPAKLIPRRVNCSRQTSQYLCRMQTVASSDVRSNSVTYAPPAAATDNMRLFRLDSASSASRMRLPSAKQAQGRRHALAVLPQDCVEQVSGRAEPWNAG